MLLLLAQRRRLLEDPEIYVYIIISLAAIRDRVILWLQIIQSADVRL